MGFLNNNTPTNRPTRLNSDTPQRRGFLGGSSSNTETSAPASRNESGSSSPDNSAGSGDSKQGQISLPTGGGAIRGIGEKFQANPVTGTASFTVPLTISEGRVGFTPQLALSYDSGSGNSAFGLGWNIDLPSITRKTDKGLPQYYDGSESDTFILSGAEDLVPVLDGKDRFCRDENGYKIYSYQPRTEGLFALIERWKDTTSGISHWRSISKENIVSVFGITENARIFNPNDKKEVFTWLIEESWDAKGNLMRFSYKQENGENVDKSCYENPRLKRNVFANKYLKTVEYGNATPCTPLLTQSNYNGNFHFKLLFDYGEHTDNQIIENEMWVARPDAFSNYKAGFEIRTYRLCKRVLMFHEFGESTALVRSTDLYYDTNSSFSLLQSVTHKGYDGTSEASLPPLTFSYTKSQPANSFKEVSEDMLKQLPAGVDGQNYQWADLYSEGVSGILTMNNNAWYFKPNYSPAPPSPPSEAPPIPPEGGGTVPAFGTMKQEVPKPSATNNRKFNFRLNDIDSDGYPELVLQGDGINGYYTRDEEGKWLNFRNFDKIPSVNTNDPNVRFMDLSGDGLQDIVISTGERFEIYFSEGKKGYDSFRRVICSNDAGYAPKVLFADSPQRGIFLADMTGDGLTDIVKVTHSHVTYYPNMGYGKFGEEVVMSNPPFLDSSEQFNTRFVHLTDVDGTGTTDLLYISTGKIRYYKNLSGNAWEEQELSNTIAVNATQQTFIQTVDLLGNGTQCVVVSSSLPAQAKKMRYWELATAPPSPPSGGGSAPLNGSTSLKGELSPPEGGAGGATSSGLGGACKPFLLSEINNNMGGITKLHYAPSTKFYMQDKFNGKPWITKLPFPVQTLEKVEIIDLVGNKHFTNRYAYHHGYYDPAEREFRGFGMVEQWDTENYELRIKNDESAPSNFPEGGELLPPVYTKTWFHTGFYKNRKEISKHYEKEYFNKDTDAWQLPDTVLPDNVNGEEAREACRALRGSPLRIEIYALDNVGTQFIASTSSTDLTELPYTVEEKSYKLKCLQNKGTNKHAVFLKTDGESLMYHYERQINDPRILHKLVLETDEYGNALKSAEVAYPAPSNSPSGGGLLATYSENDFINKPDLRLIGVPCQTKQFEIHNLNYENKKFEVENIISTTEKTLIQHSKTLFWNENCTQVLPFGEISAQALPYQQQSLEFTQKLINQFNFENEKITTSLLNDCKYLQDGQDWFAVSEVQHFDQNAFYLPYKITDQFENDTLLDYDSYNLFPVKITDALGFETEAEYDYRVLQAKKLTDLNKNSQEVAFDTLGMVKALAIVDKDGNGDTLSEPTEEYGYDLDCWQEEQKPVFAYVEKRENHGNSNTRFLKSFVYTDGLGNEIMTKTTAADGNAWSIINNEPQENSCSNRWLASGKVIYNNKGLAIKQYEPWFSDTHEFTFEDELTNYGVTPIMHYDPLGRLIQTDFPDNTTSKVEFDVWQQKNFDQNDCDETSPHYNTPQIIDLDVLGRPFRTSDNLGNNEFVVTENKLDITGRILEVKDALGRTATKNMYALSEKHLLSVYNIDSGTRWILNDTAGKPVKKWDSRGNEFTFSYDELQRPVETTVTEVLTALTVLTEKIIYGTNPQDNNIGQIIESYAQDGKTTFEYDFKGNVTKQTKQFAEVYDTQLDWANSVNLINETFVTETSYDALNRPKSIKQPDETILFYGYDKGGLLNNVKRGNEEHILDIKYNAKGQRKHIYYGNNTKTRYYYHKKNFRLMRILTTKNTGQEVMQDLNYEFDAVGNIIKITDNAQTTQYFGNQIIEPVSTYKYDALYRLIKATGREKDGLQMPTHKDFENNIPCPAANAMQNYTQKYKYDALGNMLQMKSVDNWTRDYFYDTGTNRLLRHNSTQTTDEYEYDTHGNMTKMPHLSTILWNEKDEMTSATNGTFVSYYNYDAQGNRTRKTVVKGNVTETRYYVGGYEVFRKETSNVLDFERKTLNISDDEKVFVRVEQEDNENEIVRYQYDNHLGSACLELDYLGAIISYEEYHPFGTTSFRSGRNEVEVSLRRYKYNGKERDEETGLYQYGMRYYAAWICRFVSCDPLQFEYPELTPFQYASNRCVSGVDLDGAEYLSVTNPNIDCQQENEDGTYSITLGETEFTGITKITINEESYYSLGQHMYYGDNGWSTEGTRAEQTTAATRVGIQLIRNIDALPSAPTGYWAPAWNTTISREIALSQQQANMYNDCKGVCYAVTESRAQQAYIDQTGTGVVNLTVSNQNIDHRLASSQIGVNSPFLGYGAGAPFARAGVGQTVDNTGVWAGELQTGALLQRWETTSNDVNTLMRAGGHSIIFRNYTYDTSNNINGLQFTDYNGGMRTMYRANWEGIKTVMGVNLLDR